MSKTVSETSSTPENFSGTIFFDGACGLCTTAVRRFQRIVSQRGFVLMPLQDPRAVQLLSLTPGEMPNEMKLCTPDGMILGGADALLFIARRIWWATPIWAISFVPGVKWMLRILYRQIASHRHRISGVCRI